MDQIHNKPFSTSICAFLNDGEVAASDIALAVEQRGFDGLFVPENSHMPITRRRAAPYPEARMKSLAYLSDPFVTLGACAAVTERIALGISVCLLTHRDAIATARAAASLDGISNGRFILGVAGGFVAEAMENHGSPFRDRWRIVREKSIAIRAVWAGSDPEFHGEFVDFDPFTATYAPVQIGGPPIWVGSNHATVTDKVAEYGDGWFVFEDRYGGDPFRDLRIACEVRERDHREVTIALMDAPQDIARLAPRIEAGHRHLIFLLRIENLAQAQTDLDQLQNLSMRIRDEYAFAAST